MKYVRRRAMYVKNDKKQFHGCLDPMICRGKRGTDARHRNQTHTLTHTDRNRYRRKKQ